MVHKSLMTRTMRKTVDRVDVGAAGVPLRARAKIRKMRSSRTGLAGVLAVHALIGLISGLAIGAVFGIPLNVLSIVFLIAFVAGNVIGGPFSFLVWTAVIVPVTGLIAGYTMGTWVASPAWWGVLRSGWEEGNPIPGWFTIAVPSWILFWVAASRGVAKVFDIMFDKLALLLGFGAAKRFSGEEKSTFQRAFEESDISQAETASLFSGGTGTQAVIAGRNSMGGSSLEKRTEMGGEPDTPPTHEALKTPDYSSMLEMDDDDADVMRAIGGSSGIRIEMSKDEPPVPQIPSPATDVAPEAVVAITTPDLPQVPRDTTAPLQRVQAPVIDARANRALVRRMQQLVMGFNEARREDSDIDFIANNADELNAISEEQKSILRSMADSGPLLAVAHAVQQKRAEEFMMAKADLPVAETIGSILDPETGGVATDEAVEPEKVMTGSPVKSLTPADDADGREHGEQSGDAAPVDSSIGGMATALSRLLVPAVKRVPQVETDEDVVAPVDPVDPVVATPSAQADPAAGASVHAPVDVAAKTFHGFELDLQPDAAAKEDDAPASSGASNEEEMNDVVFSRRTCREVLGLVSGAVDPSEKVVDVQDYEREKPGTLVAEVLYSRSFDEHVGQSEAAGARHAWAAVQAVLSQSSDERIMVDLERVNDRGKSMVEQQHTLTQEAFNAFEADSMRLRKAVYPSQDSSPSASLVQLFVLNLGIVDALKSVLAKREQALRNAEDAARNPVRPAPVEVVDATRGRHMIGDVLSSVRGGVFASVDRPKPVVPAVTPASVPTSAATVNSEDEDLNRDVEAVTPQVPSVPETGSISPPAYGDDAFVSVHPVGSPSYQFDMEMHHAAAQIRERMAASASVSATYTVEDGSASDEPASSHEPEAVIPVEPSAAVIEADRAETVRLDEDRAVLQSDKDARDAAVLRAEELAGELETLKVRLATAQELSATSAAAVAQSESDRNILKVARMRHRSLGDVPEKFNTQEVWSKLYMMLELQLMRRSLSGKSVNGPQSDDPVEFNRVNPYKRQTMYIDQQALPVAVDLYNIVVSILDSPIPEDVAAVVASLTDVDDKKFMDKIVGWIEVGRNAQSLIARVETADAEIAARAEEAVSLAAVRDDLIVKSRENEEMKNKLAEAVSTSEQSRIRAEEAETALKEAKDELDRLRREASGVIDDDFQRIVDSCSTALDIGVEGFYKFVPKTPTDLVLLMTTPASAFPNGTVDAGSRKLLLSDFLEFVAGRAKDMNTESICIYYTDPGLRQYLMEKSSIVYLGMDRSISGLKTALHEMVVFPTTDAE